jgi:glycosyltransferase involved in cell wall biosynthesis
VKVMHICLYPEQGAKHVSESGVASYTKNLLTNMPSGGNVRHFVTCAREKGKSARYIEDDIVVMRCFDKSIGFVWQIHKQLKKINPDVIHIQHELALFGGLLTAYLLPILVFLWRRKMTITLHGVLSPGSVDKAFVKANNYSPLPVWMVKVGLKFLYKPLARWPRGVVVHEPYFKQILAREYGADGSKIAVIPHGVEAFTPLDKTEARKYLDIDPNKKVTLFMGYAAGYKGIDLLIEGFAEFAKDNADAFLIVGAGVHPKLKNDAKHLAMYEGYKQKAAMLIPKNQYRWVGFIPESEVSAYYSAADVSLYPYTMALASSGPMSFAIGHGRPFLASKAFTDVFAEDFIFESNPTAMANKLQDFFAKTNRFNDQVAKLRTDRLWARTSLRTANVYKQIGR